MSKTLISFVVCFIFLSISGFSQARQAREKKEIEEIIKKTDKLIEDKYEVNSTKCIPYDSYWYDDERGTIIYIPTKRSTRTIIINNNNFNKQLKWKSTR